MARNFYSNLEAELAAGAAQLVSLVSPDPEAFGISQALLDEYTDLTTEFSARWRETIEASTRTSVAVAGKREAKRKLKRASATLSAVARAHAFVSDVQLIAMGFTPRAIRRPKPAPVLAPFVTVVGAVGHVVTVRIRDAAMPTSRGRAEGARGAEVFVHVGAAAATDSSQFRFYGLATRATFSIVLADSVPPGATIWISTRWVTDRGLTSVSSAPIRLSVQGGDARASASLGRGAAAKMAA